MDTMNTPRPPATWSPNHPAFIDRIRSLGLVLDATYHSPSTDPTDPASTDSTLDLPVDASFHLYGSDAWTTATQTSIQNLVLGRLIAATCSTVKHYQSDYGWDLRWLMDHITPA